MAQTKKAAARLQGAKAALAAMPLRQKYEDRLRASQEAHYHRAQLLKHARALADIQRLHVGEGADPTVRLHVDLAARDDGQPLAHGVFVVTVALPVTDADMQSTLGPLSGIEVDVTVNDPSPPAVAEEAQEEFLVAPDTLEGLQERLALVEVAIHNDTLCQRRLLGQGQAVYLWTALDRERDWLRDAVRLWPKAMPSIRVYEPAPREAFLWGTSKGEEKGDARDDSV